MNHTRFTIQPYSPKQLSALYGCTAKTLRKWIKPFRDELGPRQGHQFSPKQVRIIVQMLGRP